MDNKQIAHDIAIALLPKGLAESNTDVYSYESNSDSYVNSLCIVDTYREIYDSVFKELSSHE